MFSNFESRTGSSLVEVWGGAMLKRAWEGCKGRSWVTKGCRRGVKGGGRGVKRRARGVRGGGGSARSLTS